MPSTGSTVFVLWSYRWSESNFGLFVILQGEKNLVYAELMLKPSAEQHSSDSAVAAADKEATEYAEIVYVSPTAGAKDPPKQV